MITKQASTPKIPRKHFLIKVGLVAVGLTIGLEACGEGVTSTIGATVSGPLTPTTQAKTASISSGAVNTSEKRKMMVEFDVFSGRPNPVWDLSSDATLEFSRLVTGLPPSSHSLAEGGLGYRGFIIHNPSKVVESLPDEVRVYRGIVRLTDGGQVKDYQDTRQLEHWLEEQARQQGYSDIINQIRGSRTPSP